MIVGARGGHARPLRAAAALALAAGWVVAAACLSPSALAATTATRRVSAAATSATTGTDWVRSWSWRAGSGKLPTRCAPYSGRASAGGRWSPALVSVSGGHLRLGTASASGERRAAGSGLGCTGRAQRYGRLQVRARIPAGAGLVGRVALWPSTASHGSDWSGLTVPAADLSPAYATNGCGDEAYGAAVPGRLAGAFHTYVLTWTPGGFGVTVDGRGLYQDDEAFDGERWLGISLAATGPAPARAQLLVDEVVAYRWTGPLPAAPVSGAPSAASGSTSPGTTAPGAASPAIPQDDGLARAALGGTDPATTSDSPAPGGTGGPGAGSTAGGPAAAAGDAATGAGATALSGGSALVSVLDGSRLGTGWLVGGACAAVGVLVGVVRAAAASRRRPPAAP